MQKEMKQEMKRSDYEKMAQQHWDSLGKPIDSLGVLEKHVTKLCGIQRTTQPHLAKRALVVLCADHGCVREGVTQTDSSVTRTVAENFARGLTTTSVLARQFHVDLFPVDVGMLPPAAATSPVSTPERRPMQAAELQHLLRMDCINDRCLQQGSGDIAIEAAMSEEIGEQALALGRSLVRALKTQGYDILLTGEMGIGNTTPTSALFSAFLGLPVEETVGRGAGLSDEGLERKRDCVRRALQRVGIFLNDQKIPSNVNAGIPANVLRSPASAKLSEVHPVRIDRTPSASRAKQLLFELGGLEIATMAGMFLAAVEEEMPIVIDGAISTAAALAAALMHGDMLSTGTLPAKKDSDVLLPKASATETHSGNAVTSYALASHISKDGAARKALDALGLRAILDADLSLGEGSGAVLLLPMLDAALAVYQGMGSFEDIHVEAYHRFQ
ncbi:MAG TPA: hypothetical protein DIW34_00010 [Oribacterium sp.]|nr:hypothetical protein [Oribacterium sp.]